jgi:hypothetical protein
MPRTLNIDGSRYQLSRQLKDRIVLENVEHGEIVELNWSDVADLYAVGRLSADLWQRPGAAEGER